MKIKEIYMLIKASLGFKKCERGFRHQELVRCPIYRGVFSNLLVVSTLMG